MSRRGLQLKLYYRVCCLALSFVAAAASFNGYFVKWHFREAGTSSLFMANASFDAMVDGTAARPYVYRQLLPMLANWIDRRVPARIVDRLFSAPGGGPTFFTHFIDSPLAQNRAWFLRYWIVYTLAFLSAWIAVFALFQAGRAAGFSGAASALAAIALILLMPYFFTVGGYFYDYPDLAFSALAVWMALKCDWFWIVPLVALAAWNHESFLFFVPTLYPLLRLRNSRLRAVVGTAAIGASGALVYAWLRFRFQHNPGGSVENHALLQLHYFEHLFTAPMREKTYGLPVVQSFNLLFLAFIAWTAWRGWRYLPAAIQRHAQIAAALNIPLFLLFCAPGELRNFSLLYVTLLFLMAANLTEWMGASEPDIQRAPRAA
jgi:hypothetical protein